MGNIKQGLGAQTCLSAEEKIRKEGFGFFFTRGANREVVRKSVSGGWTREERKQGSGPPEHLGGLDAREVRLEYHTVADASRAWRMYWAERAAARAQNSTHPI